MVMNCYSLFALLWSTEKLQRISVFIYLFGVLRRFQHYTGHITTGSWKGRGNQYIEFTRVVYCKLPTNGKQLPAFPLKAVTGDRTPASFCKLSLSCTLTYSTMYMYSFISEHTATTEISIEPMCPDMYEFVMTIKHVSKGFLLQN